MAFELICLFAIICVTVVVFLQVSEREMAAEIMASSTTKLTHSMRLASLGAGAGLVQLFPNLCVELRLLAHGSRNRQPPNRLQVVSDKRRACRVGRRRESGRLKIGKSQDSN